MCGAENACPKTQNPAGIAQSVQYPLWGLGARYFSLFQRTHPVQCVLVAVSLGCEAHHSCPSSEGTVHCRTCHEEQTGSIGIALLLFNLCTRLGPPLSCLTPGITQCHLYLHLVS